MRSSALAAGILAALISIRSSADDAADAARELHSAVPGVKPAGSGLTVRDLAGHYSSSSREVEARAGPYLTGDEVYLFSDGRYLRTEWGCVEDETIFDRGSWSVEGDVIHLSTDGSVPRSHDDDMAFLPFNYSVGKSTGRRVIGLRRSLAYFREHKGNDPSFMLLICSLEQVETYDVAGSKSVFNALMRKAWRPDFFRQ